MVGDLLVSHPAQQVCGEVFFFDLLSYSMQFAGETGTELNYYYC